MVITPLATVFTGSVGSAGSATSVGSARSAGSVGSAGSAGSGWEVRVWVRSGRAKIWLVGVGR